MKKADITVIINTRDEEKNIGGAVKSAHILTDRILVIDMESNDATREIARDLGASVSSFPYKQYVEPARSWAIGKSETDWVFILDADERITKELAGEIESVLFADPPKKTYYKVPRRNVFGHSVWLKHGGWWPDHQTRLINKKFLDRWPERIHSTPQIRGEMGYLKNPIVHYFHGDLESMTNKTVVFENIESDLLENAGKKASTSTFFRKYFAELFRRLIRDRGFLDGPVGIIESFYQAYSKTITYLYLYEKNRIV